MLQRPWELPTKPDKSRPCLTHERLRLILRFGLFEFLRFLKQFRITANACYISTKIIPPPCTQGIKPLWASIVLTTYRRYLIAKIARKCEHSKLFIGILKKAYWAWGFSLARELFSIFICHSATNLQEMPCLSALEGWQQGGSRWQQNYIFQSRKTPFSASENIVF